MPKGSGKYTGNKPGGETVLCKKVMISRKAIQQYKSFLPDSSLEELKKAFEYVYIRRLADDSPYFIVCSNGLRYALILQKDRDNTIRTVEQGRFTLVGVGLDYSYERE